MKKSIFLFIILSALCMCACGENETPACDGYVTDCDVQDPICTPACTDGKACVNVTGQNNVCLDTCEKAGTTTTCTETDGRGTVNTTKCELATDGKTLVIVPTEGAYQCAEGIGCNQDKNGCADAQKPETPTCTPACTGNQVCVDIDETRKNVCADTCDKAGTSTICTETDGRGTVSTTKCDLAADGKTLIVVPTEGTYQCDEGIGCNQDKTGCEDKTQEDTTKCAEDTCTDGFVCIIAKIDNEKVPACVIKDSFCTNMEEAGSTCKDDEIFTVYCYEGADDAKLYKVTQSESCKPGTCKMNGNDATCAEKEETPDKPQSCDPQTFEAKCNPDGTYVTCLAGMVSNGTKPTIEEQKDFKCHVFQGKGVAQYVDEKTCTMVENGQNKCIDMTPMPSVYSKAICAKADDGNMHWYFENTICDKGCTDKGCVK